MLFPMVFDELAFMFLILCIFLLIFADVESNRGYGDMPSQRSAL